MDEYEIKIACWKPEYIFKNTELYKKMIDLQSKYEYLDICEVDFVRYPKRAWLPWHKDPSAYAIIWPITPTTNVKIEYKTKETYVRKTKPVFLNSEVEHRTHPCDEDIIFFRLGVNKYV
ncbi:uncharacterized protein METZ01_LOCUS293248 [marine metagenome]|uniref:Aspartyl/asparaginy/proline hydroxylase domain-containing protein n=1 Tax=marine metagenome TaxID=408172 RepID=A0A382LUJ0_9ZZZZ